MAESTPGSGCQTNDYIFCIRRDRLRITKLNYWNCVLEVDLRMLEWGPKNGEICDALKMYQ